MTTEPGFLAKAAKEFLKRNPPPSADERLTFIANARRIEADAHEAASVVRKASNLKEKA